MNLSVKRPVCLLLLVLFAHPLTACEEEVDPLEPEGAYHLFRAAMFKGDAKGVWARSDKKTHEYFQKRYERLVEMEKDIKRYLPQADHRIAQRQSGTVMLRDVKSGESLFMKVFEPAKLPKDEAFKLGSDIEAINMSEDKKLAKIITKSKQEYVLTKNEQDKQWYVMLSESVKAVDNKMKWVDQNNSALKQTVDDLIAEERKKRELIISELMK